MTAIVLACLLLAAGSWAVGAQRADEPPTPAEPGPSAPGEQVNPSALPTAEVCASPGPLREIPRLAPDGLDELKRQANSEATAEASLTAEPAAGDSP